MVVLLGGAHQKVAYIPPPSSSVVIKVPHFCDRGGAHKLINYNVFLQVLKTFASNGSKNSKKKW